MFGLPLFVAFIVLALIVTKVPVVGKYFRLVNTLIHEVGHVLMSIVTSGKVYHVHLFSDMSGVATTESKTRVSRALTSMAGYPFSSVVGLAIIYLISIERYTWVLYGLAVILIASIVFWVRNWFGWIWTLSFLGLIVFIDTFGTDMWTQYFVMFIAAVVIVESVWTAIMLFIINIRDSESSGDSYNLQVSTKIPAIVWTIGFVGFSVYMFVLGIEYWI